MMRIGLGYDAHRFAEGRPLLLGGVLVSRERGLLAHSDGDVVCHALADALLGAASLGDIGEHFPPGDPAWKDISGPELLRHTYDLVKSSGLTVQQVDITLLLDIPKISPHRLAMRKNIAGALGLDVCDVSLKATTNEGMGYIGRGEGAAAIAIAVLD